MSISGDDDIQPLRPVTILTLSRSLYTEGGKSTESIYKDKHLSLLLAVVVPVKNHTPSPQLAPAPSHYDTG